MDREFRALVAAAAFANPFGARRDDLDFKISGLDRDTPPAELLAGVQRAVRDHLAALEQGGRAARELSRLSADEQVALRTAILFDVFHRYAADFDALINEQEEKRTALDTPVKVRFADRVLADLAAWGFGPRECERLLGTFYQLRRAYHFISTTVTGNAPSVVELRRHLWDNVFTQDPALYERRLVSRMEDFSTLILGETGSGKGTIAAAIGRSGFIPYDPAAKAFSESFTRSFVAINLSQFPESLLESELFGHRKGAFTGATADYHGLLARCSPHGCVFLDEVGEVPLTVQVKLLRVLQERTYTPVGSGETQRFSGRVIAATNQPLAQLRRDGRFRDDFYYRLCSDEITVPPLRQRLAEDAGELALLVDRVVALIVGEAAPEVVATVLTAIDRDLPKGYAWPGNVRELEQAVRRILVSGRYEGDSGARAYAVPGELEAALGEGTLTADQLLAEYCRRQYEQLKSFEAVAKRLDLDRRTVKRYLSLDD